MPNEQTQEQGFDKDLLLYFLSGMGRSLSEEGSTADVLGGMTQQALGAKSQRDLQMAFIRQLLEGGGKFNMDKEKMNISAPMSALGGMKEFDPLGGGDVMGGGEGATTASTSQPTGQAYSPLNPLRTLPGIGDVSLAGLTPEDVTRAFETGLGYAELERKKMSDLMTYAGAARKDTRTALQKNYEVAQSQGFEGTIVDFQNTAETAHMKNYDRAVADGYDKPFHEWMFEMAKMGAINLGDLREREVLKDEIDFEKQITSPDFVQEAEEFVDKTQRLQYEQATDRDDARERLIIKQIESKLDSDVVKSWEALEVTSEQIVWSVTFKSGRTARVRMRR